MVGISTDLLEITEHCALLTRLITDPRIRLKLEQLAGQLKQDARHLEVTAGPAVSGHARRT